MLSANTAVLICSVVGLAGLLVCTEKEQDEYAGGESKTHAAQQTTAQNPAAQPNADEEEEGKEAVPPHVAAEKPAPQQPSGKKFLYNFDSDQARQMPAKFHSATTGTGTKERWTVVRDQTAPSTPHVVAQTSTDQTDYRFPLLIADKGSFKDLELSIRFKAVSGSTGRASGMVFRL